jgi:TolA-binding protein
MVRRLVGLFAVIVLSAGTVAAQDTREQQESGLAAWLRSMRQKLDIVSPRKTLPMTTGVAGVRGAKKEDDAKLYWKGKQGDDAVAEAELNELKEAVSLAEQGETAAAVRELEEFMKQYPDSALIPAAKKTLDLVKAEPQGGPRAEGNAEAQRSTAPTAPAQGEPAGEAPVAPATGPQEK